MRKFFAVLLLLAGIAFPANREEMCASVAKMVDGCMYDSMRGLIRDCGLYSQTLKSEAIYRGIVDSQTGELLRKLCLDACLYPMWWNYERQNALKRCLRGN